MCLQADLGTPTAAPQSLAPKILQRRAQEGSSGPPAPIIRQLDDEDDDADVSPAGLVSLQSLRASQSSTVQQSRSRCAKRMVSARSLTAAVQGDTKEHSVLVRMLQSPAHRG